MLIWLKSQGKVRYRTFQLRFSHGGAGAFVNREIKVNVGAVHEALEDLDAFEREVSKRRFDF